MVISIINQSRNTGGSKFSQCSRSTLRIGGWISEPSRITSWHGLKDSSLSDYDADLSLDKKKGPDFLLVKFISFLPKKIIDCKLSFLFSPSIFSFIRSRNIPRFKRKSLMLISNGTWTESFARTWFATIAPFFTDLLR